MLAFVLAISCPAEECYGLLNKLEDLGVWQMDSKSIIQSLEGTRDQYLKDFGSNRFSYVRENAEELSNNIISLFPGILFNVLIHRCLFEM
jgi:hypothetical protein